MAIAALYHTRKMLRTQEQVLTMVADGKTPDLVPRCVSMTPLATPKGSAARLGGCWALRGRSRASDATRKSCEAWVKLTYNARCFFVLRRATTEGESADWRQTKWDTLQRQGRPLPCEGAERQLL